MSGLMQDLEQDITGQNQDQNYNNNNNNDGNNNQGGGNNEQRGGGSFMSNAETVGKDGLVDQEVNNFANKEGIPSGADGMIDNVVNKEVNEYT